ncbi:MAG: LptF/LptG family permease [Candidatus Riflebacteria bacterium]|nr:LptF/LptG family permease [Candidatus Riflebacteria bacterium]
MQLLGPFFFGFFMFVTVIAIDPLMFALQSIVNDNVSIITVVRWFFYRLPQDMIFTFPMSVLLSTLLVFGRMSKDSETIALKAGGINFFRLLLPVFFFAILVTAFSLAFEDLIVPQANQRAQEIRHTEIMRIVEPDATENAIMRVSDGGFAYARKVYETSGTIERMLIEYYDNGLLVRRLSAAGARWTGKNWELDAVIEQRYREGRVTESSTTPLLRMPMVRETPTDFARQSKKPNEMSYRELSDRIETYDRTSFVDTTELKVELALKTSLPLASIFFALIGASFGLTSYRSGAFIGFGVSIIIIFVYYVIMSFATAMGKSGLIPVFLGAHMQNIVFAIAGIFLVRRVNA